MGSSGKGSLQSSGSAPGFDEWWNSSQGGTGQPITGMAEPGQFGVRGGE